MSSTNHELATEAAFVLLARCSVGSVLPKEFECAVKIIADTYAEPMAELEKLRRQVHMVRLCDAYRFNGEHDCWECRICDSYAKGKDKIVHQDDCPHNNEVAT